MPQAEGEKKCMERLLTDERKDNDRDHEKWSIRSLRMYQRTTTCEDLDRTSEAAESFTL